MTSLSFLREFAQFSFSLARRWEEIIIINNNNNKCDLVTILFVIMASSPVDTLHGPQDTLLSTDAWSGVPSG